MFTCPLLGQEVFGTGGTIPPPPRRTIYGASKRRSGLHHRHD
eukprot:COSAG01_NODE_2446_length_7684_cov_126.363564_1_plen_41_part_10